MGKKQKKAVKVEEEVEAPLEDKDSNSDLEDNVKSEPEDFIPLRNKQARLIVRNLSFKATEDKVRKFFSPYGELTDVQILKRSDGRLVGCCFVEFTQKTSAAKAIAHVSGQPFLSRTIVVDWAVPKDKFIQKSGKAEESEESGFHEDDDSKAKVLTASDIKEEESEESSGDSEADSASENESDVEEDSDEDSDAEEGKPRKPLRESHDIVEGCTVFVKNLPFTADNQELRKCMSQFGPIYYSLVCIDPLTEHSKGTGFVKFKTKDAAEACIAAGKEGSVVLRSSVLEIHPALSREDLHKGPKDKSKTKKDSRNLYLIKEGVILAGSPAASDVSPADMAKRLQLEQWKTQMLRNLNKFVSRNRIVIQNLPPSYDDQKLRSLCLKHGGTNPVILEARVMRDLRNVDANGKGKSKEFGFVTFSSHENALHALRAMNNNPEIFTPMKRPIVAFSIEDKKALNIRQKRLEKSRACAKPSESSVQSQKEWERGRQEMKQKGKPQQNAVQKHPSNNKSRLENETTKALKQQPDTEKALSKKEKRKLKREKLIENRKIQKSQGLIQQDPKGAKFVGEMATQGQSGIMSRQKLREQADLYGKMLKSKNKTVRMKKQLSAIKIKQPKQKVGKPKDLRKEDNFSTLVNKYKNQMAETEMARKKWYDN